MMSEKPATQSLWTATSDVTSYPGVTEDLEVDVAIIGGGITGLTAAWELKRAGKRVAVLEAYRVGSGESGQTSGHLTQVLDTRYHTLASRFGEAGAQKAARAGAFAIQQIESWSRELGPEKEESFQFRRVPGYLYASRPEHVAELEKELPALIAAGLTASRALSTPLPFAVPAALLVEEQAVFHVRRYLVALAGKVHGGGSFVFENTRVSGAEHGTPCQVKTSGGTVRATDVVIATSHSILLPSIHPKLTPYRTYALAGVPEQPLIEGLYWDTDDPYHYTRTFQSKGQQLLVVGGEDHKPGHGGDTRQHLDALKRFAAEKFGIRGPRFLWSGQVEESADGLPLIGPDAEKRHFWVATGLSGNGLTWGTLAGILLAHGIQGQPNEFSAFFAADRKLLLSATPHLAENLADGALHFVAGRVSGAAHPPDSIAELKPGEGKIVNLNGKLSAVHCDDQGRCHALSATCTHMKGIVAWNRVEQSWDCPFHGGRFSSSGEVLNGPPLRKLEAVPLPGKP